MVDMVGGGAGGGSAGVGASIDVVVLVKTTQAYIGSGAYVAAQKDINVSSLSQDVITSIVVGGAGGGSAGVAGTVSVVVVSNLTEAYTGGAAGLYSHGNIKVFAADYATLVLTAGSGAGGGAAGVGASMAIAIFNGQTKAYMGNGTIANAKGLTEVLADTTENVITTVIGEQAEDLLVLPVPLG